MCGIKIGDHGCTFEQWVELFARKVQLGDKKTKNVNKMVEYANIWNKDDGDQQLIMTVTIKDDWIADNQVCTFEGEDDIYENVENNSLRFRKNPKIIFTRSTCQSYLGFYQGYKEDLHVSKDDMNDLFAAAESLGLSPTFSIIHNCCT